MQDSFLPLPLPLQESPFLPHPRLLQFQTSYLFQRKEFVSFPDSNVFLAYREMDPTYQSAHEIVPGLWLGDYKASQDETFLRSHHIDVVFNCTKDIPFVPWVEHKYRVPVDDNLEEEEIRNLELWAGEIALKLIHHHRANHRILVHCFAGRQRSAASVAFFLIASKGMRTEDIIPFMKSKRPVAFYPRPNFIKAISGFDRRFQQEILPSVTGLRIS